MDSRPVTSRPRTAAPTLSETPEVAVVEVAPSVLARVQRLVPFVRRILGTVRVVGTVSAGSAVVLWALLVEPWTWTAGVGLDTAVLSLIGLAVLLIPAGAAFLGALTLEDLLALPGRLKAMASETVDHAKTMVTPGDVEKKRRAFGFFRAIWSARSLVLDSKGAWLKAVALVRLGRLASLPFALALLGAFALNAVVIGAAFLAVLVVIVF